MYVCMYVCVYVCMCVFMCVCVYIYIYVCVFLCLRARSCWIRQAKLSGGEIASAPIPSDSAMLG